VKSKINKIGEGYWYNVFQISENRVRKVEKTYLQKLVCFSIKKTAWDSY